jgi:hypothetical protein
VPLHFRFPSYPLTQRKLQEKNHLRFRLVSLAVIAFSIIFGSATSALACSKSSLKGTYGIEWGWPEDLNGAQALVVGQLIADGKGSFDGEWTVSDANTVQTSSFNGTYSVAASCTGSLSFSTGFSLGFYLDGSDLGFQLTQTTPGEIAFGFGLPQVSASCELTGKVQKIALNLVGTIPNSSVSEVIVGELALDGKGKVTGSVNININTVESGGTVSGTYTEASDCAGTLEITPKGSSALHFNSVFVNGGTKLLLIETDTGTVIGGTAQ